MKYLPASSNQIKEEDDASAVSVQQKRTRLPCLHKISEQGVAKFKQLYISLLMKQ